MDDVNSRQLRFRIRVRDVLVGITACLLFGIGAHLSGQHQILAVLASINTGLVAGLASAYLWSPVLISGKPAATD